MKHNRQNNTCDAHIQSNGHSFFLFFLGEHLKASCRRHLPRHLIKRCQEEATIVLDYSGWWVWLNHPIELGKQRYLEKEKSSSSEQTREL